MNSVLIRNLRQLYVSPLSSTAYKLYNKLLERNYSSAPSKMRFVQFQLKNEKKTRLGVSSDDGQKITDLTSIYGGEMIDFIKADHSLSDIKSKMTNIDAIKTSDVLLLPPVTNPEKILCVGLNYKGHCDEQNKPYPKEPMFFSKFASTLVGPHDDVIAHKISTEIDWEVELAVIIGKKAHHVKKSEAMNYVFGYSVAQDISARDWQKTRNGGQFLIGKSMDTFCPLGPSITHKSAVQDPHNLVIKCSVNGVQKQLGNTSELIFRIDDIIELVTQSITLIPGDVILTGTPGGVGMHRKPAEFLHPGDKIESEIEHLGKIVNNVAADSN